MKSGKSPSVDLGLPGIRVGSVRLPGVVVEGEALDLGGQGTGGEAVEGDLLEAPPQAAASRDPDALEHLGRGVVADCLGAEAVDADQGAVDGPDHVGDGDL